MGELSLESRIYYRVLCLIVLFFASAASFHGYYSRYQFLESLDAPLRDFKAMMDGTATRPFIYRQLLPSTVNCLDKITPQRIKDWISNHEDGKGQKFYRAMFDTSEALDPNYSFRYLILYFLVFLSAWLAACFLYLVCRAEGVVPLASLAAAVLMILLMPYFMIDGFGNFYDYPELMFMALAFWIALKFRWWWMIPVAALATWNKESFFFFVPAFYPIFRRRSSRGQSMLGVAIVGAICLAVYAAIRSRFQANPGGPVENHLMDQLSFFAHPSNLIARTKQIYGVLVPDSMTILPMALIAWTVWRGGRLFSRELRRHAQIAVVINLPLFILFCNPGEIRNLSMLYITLLLCIAFNFADVAGREPQAGLRVQG